jgi:hypothetical protein
LLEHDEISVKIWGPTATDPTTPNKRMARGFRDPEAGARIRRRSHASGRTSDVCSD